MTSTRLSPSLRAGAVLAICLALSGCQVLDTVSGWFKSGDNKSDLRGVRISVLTTDNPIAPDPTIQKDQVRLPKPYRNPEWPDAGGYPSNAMYHLEADGPLQEIWSQDAGKGSDWESRVTAPPIVAGGFVFVLDSEAHVYVFRASDGQPVWNKRLAPKNGTDWPTLWGLLGKPNTVDPTTGMGGGLAYDDGKIFATSGFGTVIAMDAATGRELWRHAIGTPIINAPVVSGGRIFFSTYDNHFYALAESDGRQLWDHQGVAEPAGMLVTSSAAVAGDMVVVPYTSGEIFALQAQNGQVNWSDVLSRSGQVTAISQIDDVAGKPVIDRDVVYAISQSGVMTAINANSGQRMWTRDIGGIQTPWAAGDYVYVLDNNDQVICLTRNEGRIRWIHQLPEWNDPDDKEDRIVWAGPVLVSNRLIVTSSNGYAESISPYTGKLLGRVEIPGPTIIAPVVANGTMYLYTADAELVALR